MSKGSIKLSPEAEEIFNFFVTTTVQVLKISQDEAGRRVLAMMTKTDILQNDPHSEYTRVRIDLFLAIPSRNHKLTLPFLLQSIAYQAAFIETLNNPDITGPWERTNNISLGLADAAPEYWKEQIDYTTGKTTGVFAKFERFFRIAIWAEFQLHQARKN